LLPYWMFIELNKLNLNLEVGELVCAERKDRIAQFYK